MSRTSKRRNQNITVKAWKGCHRNLSEVLMVGLVELLARIVMLAPLAVLTLQSGKAAAGYAGLLLTVALFVAVVLPLRCWGGEKMRRIFFSRNQPKRAGIPYKKWLLTELLRLARGCLWGLPFLACAAYFVIGYVELSVTDMWRPVQNLPTLLGMEASLQTGLTMAVVIMALLAALFAYGWWRDMPVEYLPSRSLGAVKTIHWARRMRSHHKEPLVKTTLTNILWALPGAIGLGLVIVPFLRSQVNASGAAALTSSIVHLAGQIPQETVVAFFAVFLVIYFPLCLFRKMRSAATVAQLMKGQPQQSSEHAAG